VKQTKNANVIEIEKLEGMLEEKELLVRNRNKRN